MPDLATEQNLICSLTTPDELAIMLRAGVQPERFTRLKTVVEFICGYYEKQLEIPGVDVLNAQFPDYAWNRKDDFPDSVSFRSYSSLFLLFFHRSACEL